jgi:hypothetical protein
MSRGESDNGEQDWIIARLSALGHTGKTHFVPGCAGGVAGGASPRRIASALERPRHSRRRRRSVCDRT